MARADLLCDIIKYGSTGDFVNFRKAAEAICAEERANQHTILANKIEEILQNSKMNRREPPHFSQNAVLGEQNLYFEKIPVKRLADLVLPKTDGLEPRNKILFIGAPGNGKTSLAEAIADSLMVPLLTVKYETIVGSYLGETASRLERLFEYAKTRRCVLFFDEFETLGKERGDSHETGEIKRVVSSLLLQIDALPSYVIVIAATNHESILDKAAWRRFQVRIELPKPTRNNIELWLKKFSVKNSFDFGYEVSTLAKKLIGKNYAEIEEFALSVYRQYILSIPNASPKTITSLQLKFLAEQANQITEADKTDEGEND